MMELDTLSFGQSILSAPYERIDQYEIGSSSGELTANLFNGERITLKKRNRELVPMDDVSWGLENTDSLFSEANLINVLKANSELEPEERTPDEGAIWTEKYRPRRFIDLCAAGNDRQYRLVLGWLKKWSMAIYKETDEAPFNKVLLVHGPVGIGKTCAVNVVAKQLNFAVDELNLNNIEALAISSGKHINEILKMKIKNALNITSITSKGLPTCLVIDEIESNLYCNEIIKIISDLNQADRNARYRLKNLAGGAGASDSRKKYLNDLLKRPIICIANDIYDTLSARTNQSMERLRRISEIVALRRPNTTNIKKDGSATKSIKDHLASISRLENLDMSYNLLGDIVETCEGDIRSCINYLQFNGRKVPKVGYKTVSLNKDSLVSWFTMLNKLFQRDSSCSKDEDFENVLEYLMSGSGASYITNTNQFDKVMINCFHKYLDLVYYEDDSLRKPSEFNDWLSIYDQSFSRGGEQGISGYQGVIAAKVWSLFARIQGNTRDLTPLVPDIKSIHFESLEASRLNKTRSKQLLEKILPQCWRSIGMGSSLKAEEFVIAYIIRALLPLHKYQHVPGEFLTKLVRKMADIVKEFNLKLLETKDESGEMVLSYWPNIDEMAVAPKRANTQSIRQWFYPLIHAASNKPKSEMKRDIEKEDSGSKRSKVGSSVDFFKDQYDGISTQIEAKKAPSTLVSRIWVKYNEGFSNAVRKNIGWNDLWMP